MTNVYITGIGQTPVGEHWKTSLRELAWQAIEPALVEANLHYPDALYVGNMLSGAISNQEHIGALIADFCGFRGIEATTIKAGQASGGVALRQAYLALKSGEIKTAVVVGVEKMTDRAGSELVSAVASGLDADYEAAQGLTLPAAAGLMLQRYMFENGLELRDMAGFSVNAHANARNNPNAMFRNQLKAERFPAASMVASPVNMFDTAPDADGAAALVLVAAEAPPETENGFKPIQITGSAVATDAVALHDRQDLLTFDAVRRSTEKAMQQAKVSHADVDLFELHDSFTVFAALSLESAGFAEAGKGWQLAANGQLGIDGSVPICTLGGAKARGNPAGATGIYQALEAVQQLRHSAGDSQVANAATALIQCIGGTGASVATHVLQA